MSDLRATVAKTLHPNAAATFDDDHAFMFSGRVRDVGLFLAHAEIAYILGKHEEAIQSFTAAYTQGFPPKPIGEPAEHTEGLRALTRARLGERALPLAIAAYLVGNHAEYERMMTWALEHLVDSDRFHGSRASASYSLHRAYGCLATEGYSDRVRRDLANAGKYIGGTGLRYQPPLVRTLVSLSKFLAGEVDRSETADRLAWFIGSTEAAFKPKAVLHALFLQDRFPEAFDQVLPRLVVSD